MSAARADGVLPLDAQEQEAVIAEIGRMLKTDVHEVSEFVVKEATPERIERLYHTREFLRQPKEIRENGLIFAGKGNLLAFEKPSDVIAKVSSWFPGEIAEARARERSRLWSGDVHLWGPLDTWEPEPAAFVALWKCMPQGAWLRPERNPFEGRVTDSLPMLPIAATSSTEQEHEFGFCVQNRNRINWGQTIAEHQAIQDDIRRLGDRITPTLTAKFAQHLANNRCEGRGPDDCVLVLRLWASLTPDDAELATMLQSLEPEVAPDGPLPELKNPGASRWESKRTDGQDRYDEGLRRLAFLRAKLQSVLNAPHAWPSEALAETLRQMTRMRQVFATAYVARWDRYQIDYHNNAVNPWRVLMSVPDMIPRVRSAILHELGRIDPDTDCVVFQQWLDHDGPLLATTYALQQLTSGHPSRCVFPDLAWLKEGKSAEARDLRDRYLALAETSGPLRDDLLAVFTDQAQSCFDEKASGSPLWIHELCDRWISEPQTVGFTLERSNLALDSSGQFRATEHNPPENIDEREDAAAQDEWLAGLLPGMDAAAQKLHTYGTELRSRQLRVTWAKIWRHPGHAFSLIELQFDGSEYGHIVLVAGPQTLSAVDIPNRFIYYGAYEGENDIVRVSDLDADGNLELWMADRYSFSHCQGDETDLERDIHCTAKFAEMGEIQGDVLSFFLMSKASPDVRVADTPTSPDPAVTGLAREDQSCNNVLLGSVLASTLDLDFRGNGDLISLVCEPHPLHPEQTLVALFHHPEDAEDDKGFVYAVVDVNRKRVHRMYRDTIKEDATTRISSGSLEIDTAAYDLAPGVRALGVRLNISHSPRCAEGGQSEYLRLFVEDGNKLELVLRDLPMNLWRVTDGLESCRGAEIEYTMDSVALTIAVLPSVTEGWHDLEVTAHHQVEVFSTTAEWRRKKAEKTRVLGTLRASDGFYPTRGIQYEVWP